MGHTNDTDSEKSTSKRYIEIRTVIDTRNRHSSDVDRIEVIELASPETSGGTQDDALRIDSGSIRIEQSSGRRGSQISQWSKRFSRPLSFNGSVWLKDPEDFVPQFEIVEDDGTGNESGSHDRPCHALSRSSKKKLVYLVSFAAMFSPLSSNIYFPAMNIISEVLNRTTKERLN
jgi:hypothetical protein